MGKFNQFLLLQWKNWTLQKRGVVKTIFEIGLPLFFVLILVLLRVTRIKDEQEDAITYTAFDVGSMPSGLETFRHLAFTPNTTEVAKIMSTLSTKLNFAVPRGFTTESEMVDFLSSSFVQEKSKSGFLGGIVFDTTPSDPEIRYKIRLNSRERNSKKQRENLFQDQSTSWHTKFMFPQFQHPGPRNKDSNYGGPPSYHDEGFLTLQLAIDSAIMEYKTKKANLNVTVCVRRYPYPDYINDPFILVIQQSLPVLLMLSLIFTALNIVRSIVHEKERKLKESMKMMGLSNWLHWSAWFFKYLLYLLITMVIATVFFTVKFNSNGRVLNRSDPSLIFVFLLLYAVSSIMFCFCVSVFFSKANIAAAAGGIIWYLSYTPYYFISQSYDNMGLAEKLVSCLLSNIAMGMGAQLIGKFEGAGTGVQWSNISRGVSVDDSLSFGMVLLMFVADSVLYGIITWYVEAVFPGEYGVPQRWFFPFLPSYWCGKKKQVEVEDESSLMNGSVKSYGTMSGDSTDADGFFEKDPVGLDAGVKIHNLKKVFSTEKGDKTAVNGVSLNLYSGQITALLGHNGAGKTTLMSMFTGLFPPTSGTATVNGYDIISNITGVRQSLGICPQHNILFDSLTVAEHLWFFAKLKGCPSHRVGTEVEEMINAIGLADKRDTQSRALSGGMKRKLSVGIALIADSKIVMLDEPTSGMDPSARRFTWDLIQQQRAGRTILLTTHFMDEADLLGDRIAIMAEGTVKCCGSPLFLKGKYGVGYHMVMVKEPTCEIAKVTDVVTKHVPTAQLESNIGAEVSYILPNEATGKFEELFTELETRKSDLGIAGYGASVTTMEEVFLKVGEGMDSTLSDKLTRDRAPQDSEVVHVGSGNGNRSARLGTFGSDASLSLTTSANHNTGFELSFQRWRAMFVKKVLHSKRHKASILLQLLLPLFFTLIALVNAKTFPKPADSPPLSLVADQFGTNYIPIRYSGENGTAEARQLYEEYKNQFVGTKTQVDRVPSSEDMQHYLLRKAKSGGIGYFNRRYLLAANFDQRDGVVNITAWFNNQPYHAVAISLAAVQNTVFRSVVGSNYTLRTINHPLPRSATDKINDLSRDVTGFLIPFTLLFAMAFLASSFVLFLVQERSSKAKHVQFVSGVDPVSYWTSAYLWDMINFMIPSLTLLILFVAFDVPAFQGARLGYVLLVMVMYGWGVIPLMYLFSFLFKTSSTAFVILAMFNILTGLATLMTVNILSIPQLDLLDVAKALKWAFLVLPNYCLGQGLADIFNNYNTITTYDKFFDMCMQFEHNENVCETLIRKLAGSTLQFQRNYLAWDNPGVGRYLVFLAIEGVVVFAIVLLIEYDAFRLVWNRCFVCRCRGSGWSYGTLENTLPEDDDVLAEKRRVLSGQLLPDSLVIKDLTKVFRERNKGCTSVCSSAGSAPLVAVDHLSLGISQGECFGLLGINGAGKTTTFRMLTGDETMTSGTAVLDSFDIRESMAKVRQRLGYCPQFDALIDEMTGRELLFMYARLRGVPEARIPEVSENLIQMLLIQDHADKVSKSYSGGNKRKLSTAIALIGDPPVVFLDEPTTGMDPVARRLLWDTLSRVRAEGRSIVITSHSMDECEALCTRLAIMVNGRFKCLGSTQHLKTKFGQGYTLLAKVAPVRETGMLVDTRPLKQFIEGSFPGSILKDEHEGMVHYHIRDPNVSWARIFGVIERNKLNYHIEDYSVSQTTLEQVFLNFARSQREAED